MKNTRLAAIALCGLLASNCAPAHIPSVRTADRTAAGYTTYFLLQGASSGTPAIDQALSSSVRLALADRGWLEVGPQDARAVIVTHIATPSQRTIESFYAGWGGWHWQEPDARAQRGTAYDSGTLVIDAFDTTTHRLFWRGAARDLLRGAETGRSVLSERRLEQLTRVLPASGDTIGASRDDARDAAAGAIAFVQRPVAVVRLADRPRYETVNGTDFERITNTRSFIVRDVAGMHYLKLPTGWMEADALIGPWTPAGTVPDNAKLALQLTRETARIEDPEIAPSPGDDASARGADAPSVLVTSERTTVVVTDGEPAFAPVAGNGLLHATNASAPLFKEPTDDELYLRLADGWYRAWTVDGPWQRIAAGDLPADFSRIAPHLLGSTHPGTRR